MDKLVDLIKSSALVQGLIALMVTAAICYQAVVSQAISTELMLIDGAIIGFYFGTKSEQQINRAVNRAVAEGKVSNG